MMTLIAILLLLAYFGFVLLVLENVIYRGKMEFLLYFIIIFLPVYLVFPSIVYQSTNSAILVRVIQYSKELIFLSFTGFWIFSRRNILKLKWDVSSLDFLFLAFLALAFAYMILPIGQAAFTSKAIYFKNIFLMALMYFFGRNCSFSFETWNKIFSVVFVITAIAFVVVMFEKAIDTHLHSLIGFTKYNMQVNESEPTGNYGLTWSFEAQGGQKRFGSIFSNPLELSASMLISFSASIIFLLSVPYNTNRVKYFGLLFFSFACVVLAYSRASLVAFFGMLFFMAFVLKLYRLIFAGIFLVTLIILYVTFLAPKEIQFFVLDTLLFRNSSSLGHLIEWIEAVESIRLNPLGIGLATSGNAGGVEADLQVGGENQFLIYGVQMGIFGLVLYVSILFLAIINSWRAFNMATTRKEQVIPFVAATVKFGLLLPLFTANAESYLYVSFFSWWMVGHSITIFRHQRHVRRILKLNPAARAS